MDILLSQGHLVSQVDLNGTDVLASTRQVKARGMVDDVRMYGAIPAAFPALQPDSGLYALSSARRAVR
jgi:hypothetical protein